MMQPRHRTTVAGVTLDLPVYKDPETTEKIAQQVTARIKEIEEVSQRIDTQAFALTAAVMFAAEVAQQKEECDHDAADVVKALSAILARLEDIVEAYGTDAPPHSR